MMGGGDHARATHPHSAVANGATASAPQSPSDSLTFPLRPARSPKVGAKASKAASKKFRVSAKGANSNSTSWFSRATRSFLVPDEMSHMSAKRPRVFFQRMPVFSGVGPMARFAGAGLAQSRDLSVRLLVQEPLSSGAGLRSSQDGPLVRRLRAEIKQMRSIIALHHHASKAAASLGGAGGSQPPSKASVDKLSQDAEAKVSQLRSDLAAERSRNAEMEAERFRMASQMEEMAGAEAALRKQLEEMKQSMQEAQQRGAAESPPIKTAEAETGGVSAAQQTPQHTPQGTSARVYAADKAEGAGTKGREDGAGRQIGGEARLSAGKDEGGGGEGDGEQGAGRADLCARLLGAIDRDKLTPESAFDSMASGYGELSLSDLVVAASRARVCTTRGEAEELFVAVGGDASGTVGKQAWCSALSGGLFARAESADDLELSIDLSGGALQESASAHKTRAERMARAVRVVCVALKMRCGGRIKGIVEAGEGFAAGDLELLVKELELDVSPQDVEDLASHLADGTERVSTKRWREAAAAESEAVATVLRVLTIVASALVWDIRTVFDAFPSKGQAEAKALPPPAVTKDDLMDMNDAWQFCLSQEEVDCWLSFMDSSHSGRVTMSSWTRALDPFCAAIGTMGRCLHALLEAKKCEQSAKLFEEFDADNDGKLTPQELLDSCQKEMPSLEYPEEHVRVFHLFLTYFSDSDDTSVFPSHWSAAFDLIECDVVQATVQAYQDVFVQAQRTLATEQLAVLLLRSSEGQTAGVMDVLASADQDSAPLLLTDASLEALQWRLLLEYGEAAPPLREHGGGGDPSEEALRAELKAAVAGLRRRLATRGSQLLVVLLASHKLSIDMAYNAFCGLGRDGISLARFRHILNLLAPDFGAISPRAECLFLALTDPGGDFNAVSRAKWVEVLEKAAGHLSNRQYVSLLLTKGPTSGAAALDPQGSPKAEGEAKPGLTYGERQRLCDIFFQDPSHGMGGAGEQKAELRSSLFINERQLSLALAKMGVFSKRNHLAISESEAKAEVPVAANNQCSRAKRRRLRRGAGASADKGAVDRAKEEGTTTLWDFEREVERSRVASTFEQLKLPQIFADALCDEMQPQKGICTPLAMEHLQSKHLMSWMLSLGEGRLQELLGRMYDLKRPSIINQLATSILHFQSRNEAQTNMSMNSKYSTWSGTFSGNLRTARFGKLDDFKKGLDATLGMPSFNIVSQMRREHCNMHNSRTVFAPPNNPDIKTCAADEWDYVVNFEPTKEYPAGNDRRGGTVHSYLSQKQAKQAGLTTAEVVALRLYSGPMYGFYNQVLRGQEDKQFVTTIHAIVSAIIKLASIMKLPVNRKVYRGLSGIELPAEFWQEDEYGAKGGVEFGIMSTTRKAQVAVQYSTYGEVPTIFEIEIGQVDRGAELNWISQFPGEEEVVMPPLSNLEVTGDPYLKRLEGRDSQILIVPLRVNVNIKSKTMEELEATRKGVLLSGIMDMKTVSEQEIGELAQSLGTIKAINAGQETEWFNDQVAHLHGVQHKAPDSISSERAVVKVKRLDLQESVALRVVGAARETTQVGHENEALHQVAKIMSLEQRMWVQAVSKSPAAVRSSGGNDAQAEQELDDFTKAHALSLEVAYGLVPQLEEAKVSMQESSDALEDNDFRSKSLLTLYREIVGALAVSIGKTTSSEPLSWHRGEDQYLDYLPIDLRDENSVAVFPGANRVRTVMSAHSINQHAFQVRVEAPGECLVAVGVFPEAVFQLWQSGKWRLSSQMTPASIAKDAGHGSSGAGGANECPLFQVEGGGVVMLIRTHGTNPPAAASSIMDSSAAPLAEPDAQGVKGTDWMGISQEAVNTLKNGSAIGLVVDGNRNRVSFSMDSLSAGKARLESGSKFHAAAAVLVGSHNCKIRIESAPVIWFHRAHADDATKEEVERELEECLKKTLELESPERLALLSLLSDGGATGGSKHAQSTKDDKNAKTDVEDADAPESGEAADSGIQKDAAEDSTQVKGLRGLFYNEIVDKVGERTARASFMSMLDSWKNAGYTGLDALKEAVRARAAAIEGCKLSLKSVHDSFADGTAKGRRELEYKQEKERLVTQREIMEFMEANTMQRCRQLMSLLLPCQCLEVCRCQRTADHRSILEVVSGMEEAFRNVFRGCAQDLDAIAASLFNMVVETLNGIGENLKDSALMFGPDLEVLELIDQVVTGLASSLNTLLESAGSLRQLELDAAAANIQNGTVELQVDLNSAYRLGGIAAKQEQAKIRVQAAQETFSRLRAQQKHESDVPSRESDMCKRDLLWMCHTSIHPELWLVSMFDADHADRILAWLNRQCVGSELLRMVSRLDGNTLQQTHCQKRFNAIIQVLESASSVLPLVSKGEVLPTQQRFESIKNEVEHSLNVLREAEGSLVKTIRARIDSETARFQKRWSVLIDPKQPDGSGGNSNGEDVLQNGVSTLAEADETRWELRRAEAGYWQAMMMLYVQSLEMAAAKTSRKSRWGADSLRRRSVARCLELLDDTVYVAPRGAGGAAGPHGDFAELHLDDALDAWEARILGMVSLRQSVCRLSDNCLVSNTGTLTLSQEVPVGEIASGAITQLNLCSPDRKLAAFLASFVARSSPNSVNVYVREKDGKETSMEAPICLVPGGGLSAHMSTNEANARMLDFGSKGLLVFGLSLLAEAARSDEDVLDATIAGINDLDLSDDEVSVREGGFARSHFKRKSVVEDMRFENNHLGKEASVECMELICNIIFVSAGNLQFLNLSRNKITAEGAMVLGRFFREGSSLKRLDLSDNDLQDQGAEHIAHLLASDRQQIKHLIVAGNGIGWLGALHLSEAVSKGTCRVSVLNLAENSIGSQGMVALSAALALNDSLRSLDVSKNEVGDVGAEALTHVWPSTDRGSLHTLTMLDASQNDITFVGASKLFGVDLDKSAPDLISLSLSSNLICDNGISKIAQLVPSRKKLHTLCLETQRPLHEVSKLNEIQLLVRSELWAEDTSISENDAKMVVLSKIQSHSALKNLSKMVQPFCDAAHGEASAASVDKQREQVRRHMDSYLQTRKQSVKFEWDTALTQRSAAMAMLKEEWMRAGKPLSHLNRRDLSLQAKTALAPLVKCSDEMRSKEAVFYLSDHNYTRALTTSLEAKRTCIEGFRDELFASLLQPLQFVPESGGGDAGKIAADVAEKILLQEIKCLAMQNLVEYQRLLFKSKLYREVVEEARHASASASVHVKLVEELLSKQPAFKKAWSAQIRGERLREAAHRLLAVVVEERIEEILQQLGDRAVELLKEDVSKRMEESLKKEEDAAAERPLAQAVQSLDAFVTGGCAGSLKLEVEGKDLVPLLQDLCYSHHDMSCTVQDDSQGEAGDGPFGTHLLVAKKQVSQGAGMGLRTELAVTEVFDNNAPWKLAWTSSHQLMELWALEDGTGKIADTYQQGSKAYWQEVGWLVQQVVEGGFLEKVGPRVKDLHAAWKARWGSEIQDFAVSPAKQQLTVVGKKVDDFHGEYLETLRKARFVHDDQCFRDLFWKNTPQLVTDALCKGKSVPTSDLAASLEKLRMMRLVVEAMTDTVLGLKWREADSSSIEEGSEIENPQLASALQTGKLEFTLEEFEAFAASGLKSSSYIKVNDNCFQPVDSQKEKLDRILKEMQGDLPLLALHRCWGFEVGSAIDQLVRLAKQRVNTVRYYVEAIFQQEEDDAGSAKKHFSSPALRVVLEETSQHTTDLKKLESLAKVLSFDALRSGHTDSLSLPVALAASSPVNGRKVSLVQRWHLNPDHGSRRFSSVMDDETSGRDSASSILGCAGGWVPARNAAGEWMEFDLGEVQTVAGVVTQGFPNDHRLQHHHSSLIAVEHRQEETQEWFAATPARFACKGGDKKVEHEFEQPVSARYVRIVVKEWLGGIVLRAGVLQKKSETWHGTVVQAHNDMCLVQFEQDSRWCRAKDLVDVAEAERSASAQAHLFDEIAQVVQLYARGGWGAKGEKAVNEAAKRVRKALDSESKKWEEAVKKVKDQESSDRSTVISKATAGQPSLCQWLELLEESGNVEYLKRFWNLNANQPRGSVCEVESHRWGVLKSFVAGVSSSIEKRNQQISTSINRCIRVQIVDAKSKSEEVVQTWQEAGKGVEFFSSDTLAKGNKDRGAALGAPILAGELIFTLEMEPGKNVIVGVAFDGYSVDKPYNSTSNKKECIFLHSAESGRPYFDGTWHERINGHARGKPPILAKDQVRVVYDGQSVEFFVNGEGESLFQVSDLTGVRLRPLVFFSSPGSVEMRFKSKRTKKLVFSCTPGQGAEDPKQQDGGEMHEQGKGSRDQATDGQTHEEVEGANKGKYRACSPDSPCEQCLRDHEGLQKQLLRDLAVDVFALVEKSACKVADAKRLERAWKAFETGKVAKNVLPKVDTFSEAGGRVRAALNRLPASLLAEPQCCQRMTAAVALFAAASANLPLDARLSALPLATRFLVPPFEELPRAPALVRCVELLERGTGLIPKLGQVGSKVWEELTNIDGVITLSEDSAVAIRENPTNYSAINVVGTPFSSGNVVFETEGSSWMVGISLEGHDISGGMSKHENPKVLLDCTTSWQSRTKDGTNRISTPKPEADTNRIRVEYDGAEARFFLNDDDEPVLCAGNLAGAVRPLANFWNNGAAGKTSIRILPDETAATVPERLSAERATEPLALEVVQSMSPWEARVFASVCVSPCALATASGSLSLQQIASGQLSIVTLGAGDVTTQGAAFLAHFVARCCRNQVRVKIEGSKSAPAEQHVVLSPGGGLEAHVRKDTTQSATSARDRLIFLSGMGVGVQALRLLMEAALAGLQEAAPSGKGGAADAAATVTASEDATSQGPSATGAANTKEARPTTATSEEFSELVATATKSLEGLAASKTRPDAHRAVEGRDLVQSVEMDDNPMIGAGRGASMRLVVQMVHIASGTSLVRLHLANCEIEDEGVRVLTQAFVRDSFAPRLKTLWLSDNSITDDCADDLGQALAQSLKCLTEVFLFRNKFTTNGKAILYEKSSQRTLKLTMQL